MVRHGALAPGSRIADLTVERCTGATPVGFEYLARAAGSGSPCRMLEYLPAELADRRGLRVSVRPGAVEAFDAGRRAFQLDADRFSLPRDEALAVVQRLLVEHGTAYLQLPWDDGNSLAQEFAGRAGAEPADLHAWLPALGRALALLHRGGVVHGAVSAERVHRLAGGRVVLGLPDSARWALAASLPGLVDAGDASLAPEQLLSPLPRPLAIGPWTDVYGLAALAHLAIAGRLPPAAGDREAALARPSLAPFAGAGWAPALLLAVDRALSPDPMARPRSMNDFLAATGLLERRALPRVAPAVRADAAAPAEPPPDREPAPAAAPSSESWRSKTPWRWAVTLLFAVVAALAIWTALRPAPSAAKAAAPDQRPSEMPVSAAVRSSG